MSLEFVRKLPTPTEIREQYPLSARATEIKKQRDAEIAKVFTGDSDKFLVIVGPCSADNEDAVLEYNHRLAKVADKVSDKLIIIPRVYTNKPRTTGEGYKGIVHQPDPEGKPDLLHGLIAMRKMHMRVVEETDLTSADEMLYPSNWSYLSDILSYVAVGARSVENQEHRLTGTEENLEKKNDLWRYLKQEDAADYFRIRHGIFGTVMSSKSKPGQKIAVYAYKVAQKLYGFN